MNFQHILKKANTDTLKMTVLESGRSNTGILTPRAIRIRLYGCDGGVIESSLGCYETPTYDSGVNQGKPILD